MANFYTTKTAALKATTVDACKIRENGQSVATKEGKNIFTNVNTFNTDTVFNNDISANANVIIDNGNIIINKAGTISFLDDGEIEVSSSASGILYLPGIPQILDNNRVYDVGEITEDTDLSGMEFRGGDVVIQTCEIWFTTGATLYNITWPEEVYWIDTTNAKAPTWVVNMNYRIALRKEINKWVASISYCYKNI